MSKSNCMQRVVRKYHTWYEIQENMIFTDSSLNLTNHSSNELEILLVSRFLSNLVYRHTIFLLTLLPLEKMMIYQSIIMQAMLRSTQVNHVNSGPESLHGNGLPPGKYSDIYR